MTVIGMLKGFLAILSLIGLIVILKTLMVKHPEPYQVCDWKKDHYIAMNQDIISRFSNAIRIPTISRENEKFNQENISRLHDFIFQSK